MTQRRTWLKGFAATALTLGCTLAAQAQTVVLKVHHFLPGTSNVHVNLIQAWCDKVSRESQRPAEVPDLPVHAARRDTAAVVRSGP
jgi:TRAP-type C4-dicarboxylate transport system substrate-binding protein